MIITNHQKNAEILKFQQIDSMHNALKEDFSKLVQVLEGKQAYVTSLEDKLREADYEVLCRLLRFLMSNFISNFLEEMKMPQQFKCP